MSKDQVPIYKQLTSERLQEMRESRHGVTPRTEEQSEEEKEKTAPAKKKRVGLRRRR